MFPMPPIHNSHSSKMETESRHELVDLDSRVSLSMDSSYSADTTSDAANFECNICFELAQEPIVTLCGHLYCWPCLYQWLQVHSRSLECPLCKSIVQEDKLVPIYGRGKSNWEPKHRLMSGITIPNRPMGQRPQTAPRVDINYVQPNELDELGFMPMAAARFGHMTLSTIFGALPAIFSFQFHGFQDATVYGATSGVPYLFSSSIHGGYIHGFNHYHPVPLDWKPIASKIIFVLISCFVLLHLIFA